MGGALRRADPRGQGAGVIFTPTPLAGAWLIDPEPFRDERGFFARTWCAREFSERGLETDVAQRSISYNRRRGTLRGMHYQTAPHEEVKLVRCIRGSIFDVIIDLRPESPTFLEHFSVILSEENRRALYVPRQFAHGFQTLDDDTEVEYQMSEFYHSDAGRGLRWSDPAFSIDWPVPEPIILDRDDMYPLVEEGHPIHGQ